MADRIERFASKYHFMPEKGWINDPNGVIFYNGFYHIFYQSIPDDTMGNDLYWGHAITQDFITYKYLKHALCPGKNYRCFSGGAIVDKEGKLNLFYTRHRTDEVIEQQYRAISSDGINFLDNDNLVLSKDVLDDSSAKTDFRDPNPVCINGTYYLCVGNKTTNDEGQLLIFSSKDLQNFTLAMKIKHEAFGTMLECPDMFMLDGKIVLIFSSIGYKESNSSNGAKQGVYALVGDIDFENKLYNFYSLTRLDFGSDLYAPQSLDSNDNRRVMIAWLEKWNNTGYMQKIQNATSGRFVLPRELYLKGNKIKQRPIKEIYSHFKNCDNTLNIGTKLSQTTYLKLQMSKDSNFTIGNNECVISISYNSNGLVFSSNQVNHLNFKDNIDYIEDKVTIEIFMDIGSFEIFTEYGDTISSQLITLSDIKVVSMENVSVIENKKVVV